MWMGFVPPIVLLFCKTVGSSTGLPSIKKNMGHSEIGVTMNTYTHLGLDDAKDEMIRLEELEQARKEIDKTNGIKPMKQNMFKAI